MRISDVIFVAVVTILLIVPMFLFFESDASTLPSLQTLKAIYDPLWAIAMGITVVIMAVAFFVKKDDELTLKLGLPAMMFLIAVQIIVNQMPI
jgi:hypothetical protein